MLFGKVHFHLLLDTKCCVEIHSHSRILFCPCIKGAGKRIDGGIFCHLGLALHFLSSIFCITFEIIALIIRL